MKEILKRKLKSARGASLIIAMVFMLICVFVGGSVLTAATMNAYRIKHHSDAQEFLDQRSAALLVLDELKMDSGTMILQVHDSIEKEDSGWLMPNGSLKITKYNPPVHKITFSVVEGEMTAFQRTAYESAIRQYLKDIEDRPVIILENFPETNVANLWLKEPEGTFKVDGKDNSDEVIADFEANFKCSPDFHYTVNFGPLTQMEVSMRASRPGVRKIPTVTEVTERTASGETPPHDKAKPAKQVSTTTKLTTISWQIPRIEKGMS